MRLHGRIVTGLNAMTWEVLNETAAALGYTSRTAKCEVISTFISYRNRDVVLVWSASV